jgi:phosphoglycerate kinase
VKTIEDLGDVAGLRVLVRSDLNVPIKDETIGDDGRIRASLPTLVKLAKAGAKVIVTAHLGRPKGTPNPEFTLAPVAKRLGELLQPEGITVHFATDVTGDNAQTAVQELDEGEVLLLENVRFDPREESKDDAERGALADELAALADVFVSDGFGVVHRKQASVYDVATKLPHAAGGLVLAEVDVLKKLTESPPVRGGGVGTGSIQRPYVVVLGGAKVSDKLAVIDNLLAKADKLLIGGGMVFTFLKAQGHEVGKSLLEDDQLDTVKGYLETAKSKGVEIVLPTDIVVAPEFKADAPATVVAADAIPADQLGLDIGPDSATAFAAEVAGAKTVFWNGPMGVFGSGTSPPAVGRRSNTWRAKSSRALLYWKRTESDG